MRIRAACPSPGQGLGETPQECSLLPTSRLEVSSFPPHIPRPGARGRGCPSLPSPDLQTLTGRRVAPEWLGWRSAPPCFPGHGSCSLPRGSWFSGRGQRGRLDPEFEPRWDRRAFSTAPPSWALSLNAAGCPRPYILLGLLPAADANRAAPWGTEPWEPSRPRGKQPRFVTLLIQPRAWFLGLLLGGPGHPWVPARPNFRHGSSPAPLINAGIRGREVGGQVSR